jgi:hypothetical protein
MHQFYSVSDQSSHIFNHKDSGLVADSDRYKYKGIHHYKYKYVPLKGQQLGELSPLCNTAAAWCLTVMSISAQLCSLFKL